MKKCIGIIGLTVVLIIALTGAIFAEETKYYIAGNMNGYTNPDENYEMKKNEDGIYTLTKNLPKEPATPSGTDLASYAYKVTNGTWDADGTWGADFYTNKNYGYKLTDGMGSILFDLEQDQEVTFYFNPELMLVADSTYYKMVEPYIVGDFFSEAGIGDDWAAEKSTLKLTDPDFDNIYTGKFKIPAGKFSFKTTVGKSWDESYGKDGATEGMDTGIELVVEKEGEVEFVFDYTTKITTVNVEKPAEPAPAEDTATTRETAPAATPESQPAAGSGPAAESGTEESRTDKSGGTSPVIYIVLGIIAAVALAVGAMFTVRKKA